ncbi:T9SS C-terminal target domain-containing protein [Hymenobacter oligotrophus]|uniref:Aminopeptidase N n=1 Tax=Hymenobacter oligotrophus TaxID=2319843 RepID=A0A3B7QZN7_9BACT|nr:M1 family aminopeptidase [Hymenobacter oligotrophus]AYA36470.1 T9SS C-terminal target domain-containing protein [Hymenobacter oligotrophus]
MRISATLMLLALGVAVPAGAQTAATRLSAADLAAGGEACARTRLTSTALGRPSATLRHREKMERYDVAFYKLDLALQNNSRDVSGHVVLRARNKTAQPLDSLAFELYNRNANGSGYLIDSVVVGRRSAGWRRAGHDVTAALPQAVAPGASFEARIYYRGTAPNGNTAAIGNALNTAVVAGAGVTWSLSEPYSAHEWFPCKQVLTDKADSCAVWVTTASTNKVGSNGLLKRITPLPNGRSRYEWHSRYPIAYYLISVAVAPYVEYVNYANPVGGPRIPVVNYVYNQATLDNFRAEIDRTPGFIEHFSGLVGLYPFAAEKYGHAMAPIGGGMEHQTMTTQDRFNFTLTAHELFHQWFGDNVTCGAWEDIWLNEGFASYGEYLALSRFASAAEARQWIDQASTAARFTLDPVTRANVFQPGGSVRANDTTNVGRIFSSRLSYKKGAMVVHMLRYLLNDDAKFFRALRTYQSTYANRTARTRDLQRVFEQEAGRSLQFFFDQWYRGEGYPTFRATWRQAGSTLSLRVTETVSMASVTPFFDTEVDYLIRYASGQSGVVRLRQTQPVQSFEVPVPAGQLVTGVEVDPNQWILDHASTAEPEADGLQLLPNPATDNLVVQAGLRQPAEVLVVDARGRVALRQTLQPGNPVVNVRGLAAGVYFVRLSTGSQWARFLKVE